MFSIEREVNVIERNYTLVVTFSCAEVAPQNVAPKFRLVQGTKRQVIKAFFSKF